ncbi:hypothetical protein J6590_104759, partial [Homalodisca vitripennis]
EEWINGEPVYMKKALNWYTDGSKTLKGTGAGVWGARSRTTLSFISGKLVNVWLEQFILYFQTNIPERENSWKTKLGLNTNARYHHSPGSKEGMRRTMDNSNLETKALGKSLAKELRYRSDRSSGERRRGAWISLAQGERFRLDSSSVQEVRGVRISLPQDERFRSDCSSGRGDRGFRISLAQDERFRLDRSSGERRRGAWIALAQGDFLPES